MTVEELRDYTCWQEKTAWDVLNAVIQVGGWATVFDKGVPRWASRVRNYFNATPDYLMRFDEGREEAAVRAFHRYKKGLSRFALHGAVYKDEDKRLWFQMTTAATIYHYPGEVNKRKMVKAAILPQSLIPIFKLVSPDGTGGSREVILNNPKGWVFRDSTVVDVLHWGKVRDRVITREEYIGSYNYSETITVGRGAHEVRDVKPHSTEKGFYLDPGRDRTLRERGFRIRDDRGALIAEQI
ncbi:MAG: hypothetical protein ACRC33_06170 [Gemmataceae bacterium]